MSFPEQSVGVRQALRRALPVLLDQEALPPKLEALSLMVRLSPLLFYRSTLQHHCLSLGSVSSSVLLTPHHKLLREAMWNCGKMWKSEHLCSIPSSSIYKLCDFKEIT